MIVLVVLAGFMYKTTNCYNRKMAIVCIYSEVKGGSLIFLSGESVFYIIKYQ